MFWKRKEAPAAASAVAPLPALTGAPLKFNSVEFRDGQQSLFATRMTTEDMLPILPLMDEIGYDSMEMWGGATFDVAVRFLKEDPWERVRTFKRHMKRLP